MAGSQVRYSADYGTMVVEASNTAITFEFWSIAGGGSLIDSYTIDLPSRANSAPLAQPDFAAIDFETDENRRSTTATSSSSAPLLTSQVAPKSDQQIQSCCKGHRAGAGE